VDLNDRLYDFKAWKDDSLKRTRESGAYRNNSLIMLMPSKDGRPALAAWRAWDGMAFPPNAPKASMDVRGMEVGAAYEYLTERAMLEQFDSYQWVLTREEDNVPERNVVLRLLAAIRQCPDCEEEVADDALLCPAGHRRYDGIGALYFMKSEPPQPMAFGDPAKPDDVQVRDVWDAIKEKQIIEVNGIAMGASLYRRSMFNEISRPWFKTVDQESDPVVTQLSTEEDVDKFLKGLDGTTRNYGRATQDLFFCKKAKQEIGSRFGVDCGARVGHYDFTTGEIF